MAFTSLNHYLDIEWLCYAFYQTRKDGAPGVDGQTWHDYETHLEENRQSLLDRAKSGTYRAPPVRRVYIPKGGSSTETRPIGKWLKAGVLEGGLVSYPMPAHPKPVWFRRSWPMPICTTSWTTGFTKKSGRG